MTDLIGNQLDVIFSNLPESVAHVKSGKLRALAIASLSRHPFIPEVMTTAEAGASTLAMENWTAIMAPASMSDANVAKLGAEVVKIMASPDIDEKARTQGFRVDARGPQQFTPFLKDEIERWGKIIKSAGISAS
jgi:tripartite-type tricarboxylate transporter receptor subunit TctC